MTSLFVTGTGTDIGKTYLCCQLIRAWRSNVTLRCIKPVVTGFDAADAEASDIAQLLGAQEIAVDSIGIEATSPWRYRTAISADMAADREDRALPFEELVAFSRPPSGVGLNLIEGIGGVMAPLTGSHTVLDWIASLDTSVLLVTGSYLGSLSHTLTAIDVLSRRDRRPLTVVISESLDGPVPTEETAASLARHLSNLPIEILPRDDAATAASVAARIQRLLKLA